jgi:hypothetical protein
MKLLLALLAKGGLGKLLLTGGTMLISMAVYALGFGWPYAIGLVLLILVHELGHFIAARQSGLNVGAPVFIPFVGAWISLKEVCLAPATEAHVAIAGPMLGSVAAFVCYLLGVSGHGRIYMALAQAQGGHASRPCPYTTRDESSHSRLLARGELCSGKDSAGLAQAGPHCNGGRMDRLLRVGLCEPSMGGLDRQGLGSRKVRSTQCFPAIRTSPVRARLQRADTRHNRSERTGRGLREVFQTTAKA